jgi:hypothetical protein
MFKGEGKEVVKEVTWKEHIITEVRSTLDLVMNRAVLGWPCNVDYLGNGVYMYINCRMFLLTSKPISQCDGHSLGDVNLIHVRCAIPMSGTVTWVGIDGEVLPLNH